MTYELYKLRIVQCYKPSYRKKHVYHFMRIELIKSRACASPNCSSRRHLQQSKLMIDREQSALGECFGRRDCWIAKKHLLLELGVGHERLHSKWRV